VAEKRRGIHSFRRVFQITFLLAFFVLLTLTVWPLGQVFLGVFLVGDPLIALNTLINGAWLAPMFIALVMLAVPLLLGRAFCGYVCPMGTIVELTGPKPSKGSALSVRAHSALRKLPPYTLILALALSLFASGAILVFDPLSLLTRASTILVYPLLDRLVRLLGDVAYLAPPFRGAVDATTGALTGRIVFAEPLTFGLAMLTLALFGGVLLASRLETRLWCRHICPLGALLGQVGRFAIFGRQIDLDKCISCGRCAKVCPLDAVGSDFHSTDGTRCQLGMECADVCPEDAISLGWRPRQETYVPGRRAFLGATGGALLVGFFSYTGLSRRTRNPGLIRPPGAREELDFMALCSRCGQCMKVCPTNVLQPSLAKVGFDGVFTPEMDFRIGYCDWACNECGKVCPTAAIEALELEEKRTTMIGRAYIDENRCIPFVDGQTCLVCEELCPLPEKAIVLREVTLETAEGDEVTLGQPLVIEDLCIGCGICEHRCPAQGEAAIQVRARDDASMRA
jgi:polyferredoxin